MANLIRLLDGYSDLSNRVLCNEAQIATLAGAIQRATQKTYAWESRAAKIEQDVVAGDARNRTEIRRLTDRVEELEEKIRRQGEVINNLVACFMRRGEEAGK